MDIPQVQFVEARSNKNFSQLPFITMSSTKSQFTNNTKAAAIVSNPVKWEDLPDPEVIRVGEVYYMSVSSFAFSPGAPILQSSNLADWEYIGHSVPELAFGERFYLDGQHGGAYGKGIWASTLRYRESNGLFYWYGPIQGTERTYIYTAEDPRDTWTPLPPIDKFYYDLGLLIDKDDTFYLAYGTKTISVATLTADGLKEVNSKVNNHSLIIINNKFLTVLFRLFTVRMSTSKVLECITSKEYTTSG